MQRVFLLQHLQVDPDGDEDYRFIGVYSSRSSAMSALEQLRLLPGFREFPILVSDGSKVGRQPNGRSGFYLAEQALDESRFPQGFEFEGESEPPDYAPMPLMTGEE